MIHMVVYPNGVFQVGSSDVGSDVFRLHFHNEVSFFERTQTGQNRSPLPVDHS